MGAPVRGMDTTVRETAEAGLGAFNTIAAAERTRHADVLDYWLSIRGDREYPLLHDLDPLQLSDAAPHSLLLELVRGGEDAEVRHVGDLLKDDIAAGNVADAPRPSVLAAIGCRLGIVAVSREFLAFEDEFSAGGTTTRCWVTLLPLSSTGAWVDYVYALVSLDHSLAEVEVPAAPEPIEAEGAELLDDADPPAASGLEPEVVESEETPKPVEVEISDQIVPDSPEEPGDPEPAEPEPDQPEPVADSAAGAPGFTLDSFMDSNAIYGTHVKVEPTFPRMKPPTDASAPQPAEPADEPEAATHADPVETTRVEEGPLQTRLENVRAKADEARMAKLRANAALYEGLSAAYDFALDAEDSPEEYLKLVEAQGIKIQLRSPMRPVVKLAFSGLCDESTIEQLEAVLAWALKQDLPRGALAGKIEEAGGIAPILDGTAEA